MAPRGRIACQRQAGMRAVSRRRVQASGEEKWYQVGLAASSRKRNAHPTLIFARSLLL